MSIVRFSDLRWQRHLVLRDGWRIFVRPTSLDDEPLIRDLLGRVSKEDLRLRFFDSIKEFSHQFIAKLTDLDGLRAIAFVAFDEANSETLGVVWLYSDSIHETGEYAILLPGSKLLTLKYGPVRPGVRKLALASKARQSKLLFHQRNKKVVAAKTQDRPARGVAQRDQRFSASRVPCWAQLIKSDRAVLTFGRDLRWRNRQVRSRLKRLPGSAPCNILREPDFTNCPVKTD
jgi:hypothetical protein